MIRFFNSTNGAVIKEFVSVPITKDAVVQAKATWGVTNRTPDAPLAEETLPRGAKIVALEIQPSHLKLDRANDYAQLLVTARLASGETADVTRVAKFSLEPALAAISP